MKDIKLNLPPIRPCPIYGGMKFTKKFPYATQFFDVDFSHLERSKCSATFVDPIQDNKTFEKMYAKA